MGFRNPITRLSQLLADTITGALVRTDETGPRVELGQVGGDDAYPGNSEPSREAEQVRFYSGAADEDTPALLSRYSSGATHTLQLASAKLGALAPARIWLRVASAGLNEILFQTDAIRMQSSTGVGKNVNVDLYGKLWAQGLGIGPTAARQIAALDFGGASWVPDGNGDIAVAHKLGVKPLAVLVAGNGSSTAVSFHVHSTTTYDFRVRVRDAAGSPYTGPDPRAFDWLALA
jgi:hypothetical protein